MKTRAELDEVAESLRAREAAGEVLDPQVEALQLRRSGLSVVETGAILTKALGLRLADVQELLIRIAASGEDRFH